MIIMSTRKKARRVQPEVHRPPLHLPRCPVEGKLCFPSKKDAEAELFECRLKFLFQNQRKRKETRSYLCDHCEAHHLTAMPVPPKSVSEGSRNGVQMTMSNGKRKKPRPGGGGGGAGDSGDWGGGDTGGNDCGGGGGGGCE